MNQNSILAVLCVFFLLSSESDAQQTLFSVPTGEITKDGKLYFQDDLTVTDQTQINYTLSYGLGGFMEFGVNIWDLTLKLVEGRRFITIDPATPEQNLKLLANSQMGVELADWFKLSLGTRTGAAAADQLRKFTLATFSYATTQTQIQALRTKIILGGYYANQAYKGEGTDAGIMAGLQIALLPRELFLQADFLSGNSAISNITAGFGLVLSRHWNVAAGVQLPVPGSGNTPGASFQISYR